MNVIGDLFNLIIIAPTINLIVGFIQLLNSWQIPGGVGWSIILISVLVKLITWPLFRSQIKSSKKMTELKPHIDKLKEKHKNDQMAFNQAQMALFKEHGYNPASGCLPIAISLLLLIPIYQVVQAFVDPVKGLQKINYFLYPFMPKLSALPDPHFFGVNLAQKPLDLLNFSHGINIGVLPILLVPVLTIAIQFATSKMMIPAPVKPYSSDSKKELKEKKQEEDMQTQMQSQMLLLTPIMFGYLSFSFPVGLSLYYNLQSLVSMYQQYQVLGWGGLAEWVKKIKR